MERRTYKTREGVEREHYKYSEEDISRANATNIYNLAKKMGYEVKDVGQRWAEIKGQGGLSIDKYGNRWYCHTTKEGGGPIQLLMYLENYTWNDAVKELLLNEVGYIPREVRENYKAQDKSNFTLPEKNQNFRHMFAYLIKSRFIHPDIVNEFVDKKLLYENNKKSCVFVGVDKENEPRYANIRSTNTVGNAFKGDASLSDKRFGFAKSATGNTLTIVEAPIDVLSYMTIYKIHGLSHLIENEHILSLGGVSDVALFQYLNDHPEIEVIKMGLDNDEVGNKACKEIFKRYSVAYKVQRITFQQKDFNEVLKADIQKLNQKREMEKAQESNAEQADEYETA